jgi:hypothetical protein
MRSKFPGFATVRVVCYRCGWYRILGYTGRNGPVRALIRVERARSACNVLWAKVITVPADQDLRDLAQRYPHYRDLMDEWADKQGWEAVLAAKQPYRELVQDRNCPRCRRVGGVSLEVYWEMVPEGYSVHVTCWWPPPSQPFQQTGPA